MEDYSKLDVSELFHTYETEFKSSIKEAEKTIHKLKGLAVVNPENKICKDVQAQADKSLE